MSVHALQIYDRLITAGVDEKAAREHANILEELADKRLAPKQDMTQLERSMREMELRMKLYTSGMAATIIAVLAALKYFG